MAHSVESQYQSRTAVLRGLLDSLERLAVKPYPSSVEEVLFSLDKAERMYDEMAAAHKDYLPERLLS